MAHERNIQTGLLYMAIPAVKWENDHITCKPQILVGSLHNAKDAQ